MRVLLFPSSLVRPDQSGHEKFETNVVQNECSVRLVLFNMSIEVSVLYMTFQCTGAKPKSLLSR